MAAAPARHRTRDITGEAAAAPVARRYSGLVDRWALIVGISSYRHAPRIRNLEYAHRDAEALAEFLRTPAGGAHAEDKLVLLVNERATTAALTRHLRSFLKRPVENDVVTIYFAGHGAPDPDRPHNHYLLTHDTDPSDIAGSAVPMREIKIALADTLRAEGVMVFLDACHSGSATLDEGIRSVGDAGLTRTYLEELDRGGRGIAVLTSAGHDQTSRESLEWGGGHGVFTHYLIEGMRGKADGHRGAPKNGRVTVGELFDYVSDQVRQAVPTQHPTVGRYRFDRSMLVSNTGEISATELARQAELLEDLARRVQQPWRFRDAAALYREAAEFADRSGGDVTEREIGCGRCLVQAGDLEDAIGSLERAIERRPETLLPKAQFYLAVAHARRRDYARAATAMRAVLEADDVHENAGWVANYLDWLKRRSAGRKRALVIGIDRYTADVPPICGCVTDALILRHVLARNGLFEDIRPLLDEYATRDNVLDALSSFAERLGPDDQAWVSFSGHAVAEVQREASDALGVDDYLIVHDTVEGEAGLVNSISPRELHEAMRALPAGHKTLVLDTHCSHEMVRLAEGEDADYTLLLGSDSAELAFETAIRFEGERCQAGLFTAALATALADSDPETIDFDELWELTVSRMGERDRRQRPRFVGDKSRPVFGIEDVYLAALDLAKRRDHGALSANVLEERCERIARRLGKTPWPEYHHGVGRAWLHLGRHERAAAALSLAKEQRAGDYFECDVLLARLHLAVERDEAAEATLAATRFDDPEAARIARDVRTRLGHVRGGARRALLVGIDDPDGPAAVRGAVADVERMASALAGHARFGPDDIVVLTNGKATRRAVLDAFDALCEAGRTSAATLFHFAGTGSTRTDGAPTLLCADSRRADVPDLALAELAERARGSNLVAVLDAGWNPPLVTSSDPVADAAAGTGGSRRTVDPPPLPHAPDKLLDWSFERRVPTRFPLEVGAVTIVNAAALPPVYDEPDENELGGLAGEAGGDAADALDGGALERPLAGTDGVVGGVLGTALADALARLASGGTGTDTAADVTIARWIGAAAAGAGVPIRAFGVAARRRLFDNFTLRDDCARALRRLDRLALDDLVAMLDRTIEERSLNGDRCAWGALAAGVAERERDDVDAAVSRLRDAISRLEKSDPNEPDREARLADARYLLGRTLHEAQRDLPEAISALERARRQRPDDPYILFYLGQSKIAMIERETRAEAEEHLRHYLELGAPLGHEDRIATFLRARRDTDPL